MKRSKPTQKYNACRQNRLFSDDGVRDGLGSVFEIFSLIEKRLSENAEITETFGLKFNKEHKFMSSLSNDKLVCQIELMRFLRYSYNHLLNLRLEIKLFGKRSSHQKDLFEKIFISGFSLKPDLSSDKQVVWKNEKILSKSLTPHGVCEMVFSLLINQTNRKKVKD